MANIDLIIEKINQNHGNVMPVPLSGNKKGWAHKADTPLFEWAALYFAHWFECISKCFCDNKAFELTVRYDPNGDGTVVIFEEKESHFRDKDEDAPKTDSEKISDAFKESAEKYLKSIASRRRGFS